MVLGVVHRHKQTHGYQVYHDLVSWQAETWTKIRPGSIYHALAQLEKQGMLINHGHKDGQKGLSKTIYSMTDAGEAELIKLVKQALVSYDQESFTAGLAFMSILSRSTAILLAEERLRKHKETVDFLAKLPRTDMPSTPAQHSAIITSWSAIFDVTATWQRQFIDDLKNGMYGFRDK